MERGSQIVKPLKGMAKLGHKWAGTSPDVEPEEDHIAENGTDYDPVEKGMGGDEDRMDAVKEMMMAAKKGKNKASMDMEEEEMSREEEDDEDMDKGMYGRHKMAKAEDEDEEDEMEKSVQYGVEVSEFLNELTKAVTEYTVMCTAHVNNMVKSLHASQGQIVKSVAHNLEVLDDAISKSHENVIRYSEEPARGPKSITNMSKSVQSDSGFSKEDALRILEKGVMDGKVHPLQVLKVEQMGVQAIDQSILKSLSA